MFVHCCSNSSLKLIWIIRHKLHLKKVMIKSINKENNHLVFHCTLLPCKNFMSQCKYHFGIHLHCFTQLLFSLSQKGKCMLATLNFWESSWKFILSWFLVLLGLAVIQWWIKFETAPLDAWYAICSVCTPSAIVKRAYFSMDLIHPLNSLGSPEYTSILVPTPCVPTLVVSVPTAPD